MSETILVAIITACATTIPQLITCVSNNKREKELKRIEIYNSNLYSVVTEFLEVAGRLQLKSGICNKDKSDFCSAVNKLLLYFPNIDANIISKIFYSLSEDNVNTRQQAIQPLIKELSKSLSEK